MKAIWIGAALSLVAVAGLAQGPAGVSERSAVDLQGKYGNWRVFVTQNRVAGPKTYRILSSDLGVTVLVSPFTDKPLSLRGSTAAVPGKALRVRIDGHRALDLATAAASKEVLRQMLTGRRLVLEYDAWPSGERTRVEASLRGFADAWTAASAMVRRPESVNAYLYEGCDDDYYCQTVTFCETGEPYCSTVTQTCQCTEPPPHDEGDCNQTFPCGQGQTWNASACSCDCQESAPCPEGQVWDTTTCQCTCPPDFSCGLPREWNSWTCTCTCPEPTPQCRAGQSLNENCQCSWY
jgi:hypothetical protein